MIELQKVCLSFEAKQINGIIGNKGAKKLDTKR